MKKQIGIWLDFSEAVIISPDGTITIIPSEIEHKKPKGGSRSKSPWGPMDKISESKYLARRLQQETHFYTRIMDVLPDGQELFIFGPAEAKLNFQKALEANSARSFNILGLETADAMTNNQKVARVKDFFGIREANLKTRKEYSER
jgi:hypothetical protein